MISISMIVLVLWAVMLFALERRFPAAPIPKKGRTRIAVNLTLGALVFAVSPLVQWATARVMTDIQPAISLSAIIGPLAATLLQFVMLDLWAYCLHRAYHRIPAMWRLHAPHHLDQHLDVTSAVRFHIGEILWSSLLRLIPLFVFGISLQTNILFGMILTGCALFHHSNVRLPQGFEKALSRVIVTPSIHWVHHHAVQRDTDSNYAAIFSIWDRVFGSSSATQRVPSMPIGVENAAERPLRAVLTYPVTGR
jgi:sterol desaturase/sphingolipid hydroxylase (fatty acid hydroxylase superfamily)